MAAFNWHNFAQRAKTTLSQEMKVTYGQSFLRFLYDPSFGSVEFFQLVWDRTTVNWSYSKWDKTIDYEILTHPIEQLKFIIGNEPLPSIKNNSGVADIAAIQPVLNLVHAIDIKPVIDPLKRFTHDGSYFTLSMGIGDLRFSCSWHSLPDEWNDLDKLAQLVSKTTNDLCKPILS